MPTRMTLRSTSFADPQILPSSVKKCPSASMRFRLGWHPIGCNWITPRLKSSGAYLHVNNIRSRLVRSALAALTWSQFLPSATSGLRWRWHDHEDPRHSRCQSVLCGSTSDPERAAFSVTYDMPCWPWFVHWLSARWTTATRLSLVSPANCKTGCSPSWMPPPVWFSQRGDQNA